MEVTSIRVRTTHIRQAKVCMKGARVWYASHDLSWQQLVSEGTPVELIEATGDKIALDVVRIARAEHG